MVWLGKLEHCPESYLGENLFAQLGYGPHSISEPSVTCHKRI